MPKNDPLFDLIRTLSMSEKRYFKVSSFSKGDEKNYLRLFDMIEKQEEYDEAEIKKEFKGEKITKQLHVAKNYLYRLILKSMRAYYSEQSVYNKTKGNLSDIKFLFQKKLYIQCKALALKNMELAKEYGFHLLYAETARWMAEMAYMQVYPGKGPESIKPFFEDIFNQLRKYNNTQKYFFLTLQMAVKNFEQGISREQNVLVNYEKIIADPLFQSEEKALSPMSLFYFYWCYGGYYNLKNDYKKSYYYSKKLVTLFDENPGFRDANKKLYITALRSLCANERKLKKYADCFTSIEKLFFIYNESKGRNKEVFSFVNTLEVVLYIELGDFKSALEVIKRYGFDIQTIKESDKGEDNHKQDFVFLYNSFIVYFGLKDYSSAIFYLNRILNNIPVDFRSDIQCNARIASLIVHYELGHDDLLPYLVKSVYRFLSKRNRVHALEKIIIDFIRKGLLKVKSQKELTGVFAKAKDQLEKIKDHSDRSLDDFDVHAWLESKINNKPFVDIVKQKVNRFKS